MAKGVKSIKGNTLPKVGEMNYYEVSSYYQGTILNNDEDIKWKLYVQERDGNWRELKGPTKTGKRVPYTLPEKWYGKKMLIEAYLNSPEKKSPPGLIVMPIPGERKIDSIGFFDSNWKPLTKIPKYGQSVNVRINTINMFGETLKVSLWERDTITSSGHDATDNVNIWGTEKSYKIDNPKGVVEFSMVLDPVWRIKAGESFLEGSEHEYYLLVKGYGAKTKYSVEQDVKDEVEITRPQTRPRRDEKQGRITVKGIGVNKPNPNSGRSVNVVQSQENGTCLCESMGLYWGKFFTCQERKKIIDISRRLLCDPNYLTSAMALETGGTFDPSIVNRLGYTGLIQIGRTAAAEINRRKGTSITAGDDGNLKNMNKLEQLTYVEYYLEPFKGKLNTLADFYLAILMPVDCGKGGSPTHIVFDRTLTLDYNNKGEVIKNTKWVRQKGYAANPVFHKEPNEQGKTYVWEIAKEIESWYKRGDKNKVTDYSCEERQQQKTVKDVEWHDPVDNPQLCLYTQNGNYRPRYNVFGNVRKERSNPKHQGIDLLALPGSDVYACVDSTVEFISVQSGYGNVVCLKVKDPESFKKRKKEITLEYASEGEILEGSGFNYNGDFYLFYAHLQSVSNKLKNNPNVKCGDIIGKNGTSGYGSTKDPHLHFEIRNISGASGLNNRCHPGIFIDYKGENEMTKAESDYQKEVAQKLWD